MSGRIWQSGRKALKASATRAGNVNLWNIEEKGGDNDEISKEI